MDTSGLHALIWRFVPDYQIDVRWVLLSVYLAYTVLGWLRWELRRG